MSDIVGQVVVTTYLNADGSCTARSYPVTPAMARLVEAICGTVPAVEQLVSAEQREQYAQIPTLMVINAGEGNTP